MMKGRRRIGIHPIHPQRRSAMQDDRSSNVGGEREAASTEDHAGERDPRLSAKSLAARGDAPDASEDGRDPAAGADDAQRDE
jgi:hypothetical protein